MNRTPFGGPIPTPDGHYVQLYDDGSSTTYNGYFNVVRDDPSPNPMRAALASAGRANDAALDAVKNAASGEDARRFDLGNQNILRGLDQRATEIGNTYKLGMLNARTQQDQQRATAQYQADQTQLQRDRLQFDRETQAQQFGLAQAGLGMRGVELQANLRGVDNYWAADQAARNFSQLPGAGTFLDQLQSNTRLPGFGAQGAATNAVSVGSLTAKLAAGGQNPPTTPVGVTGQAAGTPPAAAAGGYGDNNALLNQIHSIGQAGAHKIGAGVWESLNPNEQGLFLAGLEAPDQNGKAFDKNAFLSDLWSSRIGQGTGLSRAA